MAEELERQFNLWQHKPWDVDKAASTIDLAMPMTSKEGDEWNEWLYQRWVEEGKEDAAKSIKPRGPSLADQLREAMGLPDVSLVELFKAAIERVNKLKELTNAKATDDRSRQDHS